MVTHCVRSADPAGTCSSAGSTQQHWPFPGGKELVGYAYLFTHPGEPFPLHLSKAVRQCVPVPCRTSVSNCGRRGKGPTKAAVQTF